MQHARIADPTVFSGRARVVVACGAELGEGPVWDHRTSTLIWVDIKRHALWRWRSGESATAIDVGEPVGFAVLTPDPETLIVGLKSGIARLDLRGGAPEVVLRPEPNQPGNRLNDATVGPDGSLYFGSMDDGERERTGAFYRWSAAGLERFADGIAITNGPAIDGSCETLYAADTLGRSVYRYRLDTNGTPVAAEPFTSIGEGDGHPDGLAVDAEGHVWIALHGAGRIVRYAPDGRAVLDVPIPTGKVTKAAFGGPDLATLFVTSARMGLDPQIDIQAGHVFAIETGVSGRRAEFCTMLTR